MTALKAKAKKKNEKKNFWNLTRDSHLTRDPNLTREQVDSIVTTMAGGSWKVVALCFILNVVQLVQNTLVCGLDNGLALTPPSK